MDDLTANELSILEAFDIRGVSRKRLMNFTSIVYAFKGFAPYIGIEDIHTTLDDLLKKGYLLEVIVTGQKQWRLTEKASSLLDHVANAGLNHKNKTGSIKDLLSKADALMNRKKFHDALVFLGKAMDSSEQQKLENYSQEIQRKIQECMLRLKK